MQVTVEHGLLLTASRALEDLAARVSAQASTASGATPIDLPSLDPLAAKTSWMTQQVPDLESLAALALLLDTEGTGRVEIDVPSGTPWDPAALLDAEVDRRFGDDFADSAGLDADELRELMICFGSVGQKLPPEAEVMSADDLRTFVIARPDLARALTTLSPRPGSGPEGDLLRLLGPMVTAPGGTGDATDRRRGDVRRLFTSLGPEGASILATMFASTVGNLSGVPFENRADANTVRVVVALDDEGASLDDLRAQHEENQHDWDFLGRNNDDLEDPIADAEHRLDLYRSILDGDRQIVYFDPAGDGAMAELHGRIDARTDNVGVIVPGTGSDLANFDTNATRSRRFQDADPTGGLSMVTWMGGDLPDSVTSDAPFSHYADDLAPGLAEFSRDVRAETDHAGDGDARVTYAGHSYGGAVVGRAEVAGLDADRVLHVESAGMGRDVWEPDDLPASQADVDRYSMTAPGDPIGFSQGVQLNDSIGHGGDPDEFDGTTRLHTGNKVDGTPNQGADAHSGVFEEESDAWWNMYGVFTGGEVDTYRTPQWEQVYQGYGGMSSSRWKGWADDGERVDVE